MTNVNIPAVTTGAFLGLLALICLVACMPPVTRFLGDLCCCPWRIPFTKKKRRNGDEEMDRNDLPYVAGRQSPRPGTPVDGQGYQRVSAAYMSAVSVVDPELAKEEMQRSAEYRRGHSPQGKHRQHDGYYQHHDSYSSHHLQVPGSEVPPPQGGNWRRSSPERNNNYPPPPPPPQPYLGDEYPPEMTNHYPSPLPYPHHGDGHTPEFYPNDTYDQDYVEVQRPQHAYSPPDTSSHGHGHGYFPQGAHAGHDYDRHYQSSEQLFGQQQHYPNI